MSKISLTPNASGTGTFTIASPNSSTDRTLTLPDNTGTIITTASTFGGTGPAFSAIASGNQTVSFSTITKIDITSETFDTNSNYDAANSRFTPTVAGYYQVNGALAAVGSTTFTRILVILHKNGTEYSRGTGIIASLTAGTTASIVTLSEVVYMNGSTDYIELYGFITGTGTATFVDGASNKSRFSACLVRGA